jgi:predicted ribosomally synthesized peptide with nif11-like leader
MSQMHIEKFYEIAANDQALLGQLIGDTSSPEEFVENVVAAAKERGLSFSAEEANTWIAAQQATKANDELSDTQLEGVAGGKEGKGSAWNAFQGGVDSAAKWVDNATDPAYDPAEEWTSNAASDAVNWFKSW